MFAVIMSQSSTSLSTNDVLTVSSQQPQSRKTMFQSTTTSSLPLPLQQLQSTDGVLISGLLFFIIGIIIVVVG